MLRNRFETKVRWTAFGAAALLATWGCGGGSSNPGAGGAGGGAAAAGGSASPGPGGRGGTASGGQAGATPTGGAGGAASGGDQGAAGAGGGAGSPSSSGGSTGVGGGVGGGGKGGLGGSGTGGPGGTGTGGAGGSGTGGPGGRGAGGLGGSAAGGSAGIGGAGGSTIVVVPQVTSLAPMEAAAGVVVSLTVHGQGIAPGWTIYFNGSAVPTTISTAGGETVATASFTIATSVPTGQVPVWLTSGSVTGSVTSNTVYFTVTPAAGAPTIVDYTPDNALPGTKISIVGTNFATLPLTITDPLGRPVAIAGTGTTTWVGAPVDRVDVVIPTDMPSGAFTATNSKGSFRGRTFNVGMNLARLPGTVATASTQFNTSNWSAMSGFDNDLQTSWFSAPGDCATQIGCTHVPTYKITFASPQMVGRIAMRGNREYASGYDFIGGRFEVMGAAGATIWSADRLLPDPDRDLDILISPPLSGVTAVRFTSTADQSDEPGFSELEVFGP